MDTKEIPLMAWFTYKQASKYCGLGRTTLTALVTSGELPAVKVGKAVRINRAGLDDYMQRHTYVEVVQD